MRAGFVLCVVKKEQKDFSPALMRTIGGKHVHPTLFDITDNVHVLSSISFLRSRGCDERARTYVQYKVIANRSQDTIRENASKFLFDNT